MHQTQTHSGPRPAPVRSDPRDGIERELPNNRDAERGTLGAILLENSVLRIVAERLEPQDFFDRRHALIFRAMLQLEKKQTSIDLITVVEELTRIGELESVGGVAYVSTLADGLPRVNAAAEYAKIVSDRAQQRQLIYLASDLYESGFAGSRPAEETLAEAEAKIAKVRASTGKTGTEPAAWRDVFHTYDDFENCPSLSFAIGGFLQNEGATMIGGLSGHGKTLVLCSIAKALLTGKGARLWDLFPVEENCVRVIYLIPECSLAPFKHRLNLFGIYECLAPNDDRLLVRTLSKGPAPVLSDPRILFAVKGAHVILDTASRFSDGDENAAGDNARGLANDIFALLASGARSVVAAHHSPKPFARENTMRLENVLRGSGDIGAMLTTAWGVKQLDAASNIIHIENIKPRDFQPCAPFQIIGRPYIDETGDFQIHKRPGECGALQDEQEPERDRGGAPAQAREARAANMDILKRLLCESPALTSQQISQHFRSLGIKLGDSSIRKYRKDLGL